MRVTVIGAGYVGAVSAAVLAYLGNAVTCVERDAARLAAWSGGSDPLREPGLEDLLRDAGVHFTAAPDDLGEADVILIAVGTPMGSDGRADLDQVETAAAQIGARAKRGAVVLVRSTVPVGTCDRLQRGPLREQLVVSNPEFLREGHAVRDSFLPDRIVAGGPPDARPIVAALYARVIDRTGIPGELSRGERCDGLVPFRWMSAASAELAKYAANGFLATKLSFANEIANLARAVGADASAVLGSMGLDPRIGSQFLRPGLGWGGSCFPKDTRALQGIADGMGYDFLVLKAAIDQNARQLRGFAAAIERSLPQGATIGLLGLAFKAGTADVRESPAVALARLLVHAGMSLCAYDPAVGELAGERGVVVRPSVDAACAGADAVVIATEWPEFAALDLGALRQVTRGDLLFDGRSLIAPASAKAAGFRYAGPDGFVDATHTTTAAARERLGTAA